MFWNLFVRPKCRLSDKVDVCVTTFETEDESLVHNLFYKRHVGLEIITTSEHVSRELAYKQIYDLGSVIQSHFEFYEPSMMCRECKINPVGSMGDGTLCYFCHAEEEYERSIKHQENNK